MRYKKFLFLFLLFFFPIVVDAKACTAVKGTGNNIGDEIACGSEHFYILEKNGNNVKLLAKYNLYVGDKIEKDSVSFTASEYGDSDAALDVAAGHCADLANDYEGIGTVETTGKYTEAFVASEWFCRIYTPLTYDKVKQSELARGLYPNGNKEVVYPIYGSVELDADGVANEFDENNDMIPENSQVKGYLDGYKTTLSEIGVNVLDIGFIKKSGLENFVNSVSSKKLTIPTYNPDDDDLDPEDSDWVQDDYLDYDMGLSKINIVEYVPEEYKWIYGTTYWIGSATVYKHLDWQTYYDEFLSTVGDYCSYSRGCHITKMGVGLRPVVMISSDDILLGEDNPQTSDLFGLYLIIGFISICGLGICLCSFRKKS